MLLRTIYEEMADEFGALVPAAETTATSFHKSRTTTNSYDHNPFSEFQGWRSSNYQGKDMNELEAQVYLGCRGDR
jgi:hypothetical protein